MPINFEKYDKLMWRAIGTLILVGCVGSVLVGFVLVLNVFKDRTPPQQRHDIVNVNQSTKKEERLRLGSFQPVKGTDLILIPLTIENDSAASFESSYDMKFGFSNSRNFLIFNTKTKASSWVWGSNSNEVFSSTNIYDNVEDTFKQKTLGIAFEFVSEDTDLDGKINHKDQRNLHYFEASTKKLTAIVDKIDRSIGTQQTSGDEVLFFYSRGGKSYFKSLALSNLAVSAEKEIGLAL